MITTINVRICDIHQYLRRSELVKNLDFDDEIEIKRNSYKSNISIDDSDDFIELLKTVNFFDIPIPWTMTEWIKNNPEEAMCFLNRFKNNGYETKLINELIYEARKNLLEGSFIYYYWTKSYYC